MRDKQERKNSISQLIVILVEITVTAFFFFRPIRRKFVTGLN
jgi:hypothetical protein